MPGGWRTWPRGPLHGLLDRERAAIAGLFDAWGEIDRSHRKLAHRGSRIGLVHVSESTCAVCWPRRPGRGGPTAPRVGPGRAVAGLAGVEAQPRAGLRLHPLTQARRASIAILDMVSRKWLATLTSAEETSTQVEAAFLAALGAEDLLEAADQRAIAALREAIASGEPSAAAGQALTGNVRGAGQT